MISSRASAVTTSALISRRSAAPHTSMFLRMLWRAAVLRRGRAASALLAMVVAAAAATAMLNLYADVQTKLQREFRGYGANVVVVAEDGQSLPSDALRIVSSALAGPEFSGNELAVPFAYVVARTSNGRSVVVAGTDFQQVQKLDQWWSVTAWPNRSQQALMGVRAADFVSPQGAPFDLSFQGYTIHLIPAGTLRTGADEDSRIYLPLSDFEAWTGLQPSTIEIAASGSTAEVNAAIERLAHAIPAAQVRPIRQLMEGESRVLGKTRATLLSAAVLIILTAALCVLSTLTGWVFDRRKDFAIMKALGASQRLLSTFFAAETAVLCVTGAILGYVSGVGIAAWIGHANFHASVTPKLSVFPPVLVGSIVVGLLAAILPISLLRRVEPAMILRGE
jgi:putative ABC transport system permease protein